MREIKDKKQNFGITLIELLTVIAIFVVLTAITIPAFNYFQKELDLNNSAEKIINTLRLAQNKTISSEGASQYGVFFDTILQQYTLFKGQAFSLRDNSFDEIHKIPDNVEIYEINITGGGLEEGIVFNRLTGETTQSGNISLRLKTDTTKTKTVYISNSGQIGLNLIATPPDNRIKDSRHVHFNYNQNVQGVISLHLVFPDYPADNYDISFQDYLNTDKTEFDWEGIVLVGPEGNKTEQRLRIHTHTLTSFIAQFCIHRPLSIDQSYNDKALNIFLDDEELIRYAGDERGTTNKGSSFWVVEDPVLQ